MIFALRKFSNVILLALVAIIGAVYFSGRLQGGEKSVPRIEVLIAQSDIPAGSPLKPEQLAWQAVPENSITSDHIRNTGRGALNNVIGRYAVVSINQNQRIYQSMLTANPRTPVYRAREGYEAFTLRRRDLNRVTANVKPNDRIDIIFTIEQGTAGKRTYLIKQARVLNVIPATPSVTGVLTLEVKGNIADIMARYAEEADIQVNF